MGTVEQEQDTRELGLPPSVQEALGELVSAAKDGPLALSVGAGLGVLPETTKRRSTRSWAREGQAQSGPHRVRHGHEGGEVTLGGRASACSERELRTASATWR